MTTRRKCQWLGLIMAAALLIMSVAFAAAPRPESENSDKLRKINHFVVIYQENHSFDNLYGGWEHVMGLSSADIVHTQQVNQANNPFQCLKQDDPSLTSPTPLPASCTDTANGIMSAFTNAPFFIDDFIPPTATTCPNGAPGGCTRDLVHRFL